MEEKNTQQPIGQEPAAPRPASGGRRVIQPTAEILEEVRSQPTAPPVAPHPTAPPSTEAPGDTQPPATLQNSPVPGPGPVPPSPPPPPAGQPVDNQPFELTYEGRGRIILIVRIIASVLILSCLGSLYVWYQVNRNPGSLFFTIASLVVAVGIFRLREIARKIYVIYAAGVLILAVTIASAVILPAMSAFHKADSLVSQQQTQVVQQNLTAQEKAQEKEAQQRQAALEKKAQASQPSHTASDAKDYAELAAVIGAALFIGLFPLVYLTRPRVKAVFH
ncbi:MAG TPA: hypothetical protein VHC21_02160 [Candidatus Saccharimonadales bacterium]|nr:hypothetical protein [Candidatus Saccharimonadales bacterium]